MDCGGLFRQVTAIRLLGGHRETKAEGGEKADVL